MVKLIINGVEKHTDKTSLSYDEIVEMADSGRAKTCLHSVVYSVRGQGDWRRSGTVTPGKSVEVADGMVITALVTDNA